MLKKYSTIIIHSIALSFFLFSYYLIMGPETVSLFFLLGSAGLSIGCGLLLSRLKGTILLTLLAGIIIPPFLHFFVGGIQWILTLLFPQYDSLLISFDSNMALFFIPLYMAYFLTFLAFRFPRFITSNTALFGVILLIVSSHKHSIDSLYTDRKFFLIQLFFGVILFFLCAILLVLSRPISKSNNSELLKKGNLPNKKKGGRSNIKRISLALATLLLFLSGAFFLLTKLYTSHSMEEGGGLLRSDLFRFDFSDLLSLESKIEMSDDLILLFRKEGFAENYKIRRFVLNGYSPKKGFYRDPRGAGNTPQTKPSSPLLPKSPQNLPDPDFLGRTPITQEYYLLNINPSSFLALNYPTKVIPYQNWPGSSFNKVYKVESKIPDDMVSLDLAWIDKGDHTIEEDFLTYYSQYGEDQRIQSLAQNIVRGETALFTQAKLIENYLQENYFYSLQPGLAPDGDQLSFFLYETKKGYCSYFAFAMTLLCRSIGLPARIAVGFSVTPESELLNFYPVLANQAHAWVEVYFDHYGWISFDPTSSNIAPGEDIRFGEADTEEFISLIEEILKNRHNLNPEMSEEPPKENSLFSTKIIFNFFKENRLLLLLLTGSTLILLYLFLRFRFYLFPLFLSDPKKKAKYNYLYLASLFLRLGFRRKKGETPLASAIRCDKFYKTELTPVTNIYLKALFGKSFSPSDYSLFLEKKALFRSSLKTLSRKKRLLLLFNPIIPLGRSL